jgi:NAD+ kinase
MKKIGLVVKNDDNALKKADELVNWLQSKNIDVVYKDKASYSHQDKKTKKVFAPSDLSCVFVLGGDGTFLSAVRWLGDTAIPILGIKFGQVGFLAEQSEKDLFSAAELIIKKKYTIKQRMRLNAEVIREGKKYISETALNDIVINKGALARLADIKTYINDRYLTTYRADGLIVSTPTGSTAYSLAAGGPVLHPDVPGIIMTPICPFTLTNRPLIVPDSVCIKIELSDKASDLMLTVDGQEGLDIKNKDVVFIKKWPHPLHMITLPNHNYFDILKTKLRWSGSRL